ncbi:hypothetical protein, partial [Streptomyces sp. NPDC060198]|uniref:hypothetical protein n=1 Tax=Streptomyces sp. NPDC060198 TaxID=3347070 RepID=UPI003658704C
MTSQKVPLHHVFGTYLQSRADTTPDRSLLLGEGENEFLALGEGAPITYHGTNTPPVLPITPTPPRTVSARAPRPGTRTVGQSPLRDTATASTDEPSSTDDPLSEREIAARARLRAAESALEAAGLRADDLQQRIDTATDPLEEASLRVEWERHTAVLSDALREVDLALTETRPTPPDAGPVTRPRMRLDRTPRFSVPSRFDVRRIRHDDDTVTDLTITIGFNGGNSTAAWNKLRQGVEEYYNAPGHRLPGGDLLHITVEPAPPGTTPHLTVDLVGQDTVMDQNNWHHDANPVDYAHELGHQLGLRDEYQDETVPHRPDIKGSLLGNYHQPSPDALPQAQLRPRHLELLATLIGDTDTDIQNSNGN